MISFFGNILAFAIGALCISTVLVLVLLVTVHLIYPDYLRNALLGTVALTLPLFVFLLVQSFLFCGAVSVRNCVVSIEENVGSASGMASEIISSYPFLSGFFPLEEGAEVPDDCLSELSSAVSHYIWRRVLWGTGVFVLAGLVIFFNADKKQRQLDYLRHRNLMNL